ncbi:uncharacterized protein lrrc31 isoform 2-T2 [Spinachia spinachia]
METAGGQRGRDAGGPRRSPLDLIMNQIRRKRSASDRKPLGRFLSRDRTSIPEAAEETAPASGVAEAGGVERDGGWGRVCVFLQKLGKKADSRSLRLSHCDLTATDLLELATLLRLLPRLEELDVSWNELIGGCLTTLTSHLQQVGGIRALRLCSCRLNAADVAALGEALGCVPLLEVLDLSWNSGVGGGALQCLLGNLPPPLRELHLVACRLTAADAASLAGMVSAVAGLCVLDLSCNPQLTQEVDTGGFAALASGLPNAAALATLRLQDCGLRPGGLEALGGSLHHLPSLRELDLSCNKSLAGGLDTFAPHLAHLTHLESLDLHLCRLTRCDLEALIQVLPSLAGMTQLDVSSNQETGGVVDQLVAALPLPQMRRLPLNSSSLNKDSFTALGTNKYYVYENTLPLYLCTTLSVLVYYPHCTCVLPSLYLCTTLSVLVYYPHCTCALPSVYLYTTLTVLVYYPHCTCVLPSVYLCTTLTVLVHYPQCTCVLPSQYLCTTLTVLVYYPHCTCVLPSQYLCTTLAVLVYYPRCTCALPSLYLCTTLSVLVYYPHCTCALPSVYLYTTLTVLVYYPHCTCVLPSQYLCTTLTVLVHYPQCTCILPSQYLCTTLTVLVYYPQCTCALPSVYLCTTLTVLVHYPQCTCILPSQYLCTTLTHYFCFFMNRLLPRQPLPSILHLPRVWCDITPGACACARVLVCVCSCASQLWPCPACSAWTCPGVKWSVAVWLCCSTLCSRLSSWSSASAAVTSPLRTCVT